MRKPAKPKAPEALVLRAVLESLRLHPRVAWAERMNSGATVMQSDAGKKRIIRFGFPGLSDIIGQMKDGRLLAVECKSSTGRLTIAQSEFLDIVGRYGGMAFMARSVDDVMAALGGPAHKVSARWALDNIS